MPNANRPLLTNPPQKKATVVVWQKYCYSHPHCLLLLGKSTSRDDGKATTSFLCSDRIDSFEFLGATVVVCGFS